MPAQSKGIMIAGTQHNEVPVVNGMALVACQRGKCALYDSDNGCCGLVSINSLLEIIAFGDDDEDDSGEESLPEGGDDGTPEKVEPVPVDQGSV